ncbi:MAG: AI-2E family transporter [Proteobacteria bacterium]|nr:AI-2E family transporter [Pseudomonadota bacterium]
MRRESHVVFWALLLAVAVGLIALLSDVLLPFAVGATLAYLLNPIADSLERIGIGRSIGAALIVGLAALAVVATLVFVAPLVAAQVRQLATTLPGDLERLKSSLEAWAAGHLGASFPGFKAGLEKAAGELSQGSSGMIAGIAHALWARSLAVVNLLSLLLVTPVVAFYLLRDWNRIVARIDGWVPLEDAPTVRHLAGEIDSAVAAFVRGQAVICLVLGAFYSIALSLVGLRYSLGIGLATGLLSFVPVVGWALGLAVSIVVAVGQSWPDTTLALEVLAIFAMAMALDSAVLSPGIVGQRVGLHPVWLMLALFVFSALFGLLGTVVAVPVSAALAVLVRYARDRYLASALYQGEDAGRQARSGAPARKG